MPVLDNHRHELFAQGLALGKTADQAYQDAGFEENRGNATRLKANESVQARVEELLSDAAFKVGITREFILNGLKENYGRAMQAVPVLDREGKETGEYRYEGSIANRSLELMGKDIGMFVERSVSDVNARVVNRVSYADVDDETMDKLVAARAKHAQTDPDA